MYWIWSNEPTSDDEAMIYGVPRVIEDQGLKFDQGALVTGTIPDIEIIQDDDSQGVLTDNLIASGSNGLLFSSRLRRLMETLGIENVQYFPCRILNPQDGTESTDYQLANIIGRVACLDKAQSTINTDPDDPEAIEFIDSLSLDESKIRNWDIFRLNEVSQIIVVSDRLKVAFDRAKITGVKFYAQADFVF
jgi:hypothetical protein